MCTMLVNKMQRLMTLKPLCLIHASHRVCHSLQHLHRHHSFLAAAYSMSSCRAVCMGPSSQSTSTSSSPASIHYAPFYQFTLHYFSTKSIKERYSYVINVKLLDEALQMLMGKLDVEEAVELIQMKEKDDVYPTGKVTIDLMQQLANLGEYEMLLDLKDILVDREAVSESTFNTFLQEAYQQSGRVDEAVDMVRKMYFIKRHFRKVSTFFTQVTNMIIRDYPGMVGLVEEFVDNCMEMENPGPDYEPLAHLWKCFVMCEEWDRAQTLLESEGRGEHLFPQLHCMVASICEAREEEKAGMNEEAVLRHLVTMEYALTPEIRQQLYCRLLAETGKRSLPDAAEVLREMQSAGVKFEPSQLLSQDLLERLQQLLHSST